MTKTEQVARAIAAAEQQPDAWQTYERAAIAAMNAMRGENAGLDAVIDAALAEKP